LAEFKARVINGLVVRHGIHSVVEFGCGDGNQLQLASYPTYIGLDVSPTAVQLCKQRFADDATKSFFRYDPECFVDNGGIFQSDLALSLDVIYHLVEDVVFERHLTHLFQSAERFVIVYASDEDRPREASHVRHRRFTPWVEQHQPSWSLIDRLDNEFPVGDADPLGSFSSFYVYQRGERPEP